MAVSDKNKQWFSSVSIVLMKPINELYSYTLITVGYFGFESVASVLLNKSHSRVDDFVLIFTRLHVNTKL